MAQSEQVPEIALAEEIALPRLLDLSAQRLGISVEYDSNLLKGILVTLRADNSLSDRDLWRIANQLLAARGFTTIETSPNVVLDPSSSGGSAIVLSVVKLTDAAGLARIERGPAITTMGGYGSILLAVEHRPLKEVAEAVKALVSKPAGAVQELAAQNALVVSDLTPRLEQISVAVRDIDTPGESVMVEAIESQHIAATRLVELVTAAVTTSNPLAARPLQGRLIPTADDAAAILIAPGVEVDRWRQLVAQFDRSAPIETRTYNTMAFPLAEVTKLIDQAARRPGPRGSGGTEGGWRVVQDPLGQSLIVSATAEEHKQIEAIVNRLNALPPSARRPVRVFVIRNRSVAEVVDVLSRMAFAGVAFGPEDRLSLRPSDQSEVAAPQPMQRADGADVTIGTATRPATREHADPPGAKASDSQLEDRERVASLVSLTADEGTNSLIAVGETWKLAELEHILRTLDVRQPQVMIEVLVVSLNEGDTLDLGVELEKIEISGDTVITLSSLFGLTPAGATSSAGKGFSGLILDPGDFRILIRALQTLNNGRSLNMPRVLVNNNQQANLDAVVQQPFVSTNASDTVATTSFGGFESAGTTITIKPQIATGDHLVLEYSVSLSAFVGESSDAGIPPPRQQNTLQSVVTIPDGYTVVVGGIEITTQADATSQVPLLGDVPILGEAFKSRSRSKSNSRFFVFLRPTILRNEGFEDLKYLSSSATRAAVVDDGFPQVEPRIIK